MSRKPDPQALLRAEAEAEARLTNSSGTEEIPARPAGELLHELRVHQIELEMQNEELRRAQVALEESRDRYVDLYEFAPVGYLTLNRSGMVAEANLTGAALLGVERRKLLNRRFANFISPDNTDLWHRHFLSTLQSSWKRCELLLKRGEDTFFHAQLDCRHMNTGEASSIRIALTDITERKHAEQQLRELSAHLQTVRDDEKTRIAREIHDELCGSLSALKIEACSLAQELSASKKRPPQLARLESMSEIIDSAMAFTRDFMADLHPSMLDDVGLLAALEWQAGAFSKRTRIECLVTNSRHKGGEDKLDRILSINLFRIFQETLTNVARHSGASRVETTLYRTGKEVALSISDNGCGLPDEHAIAPTSYGIRGMRERVEQLGGRIEFDSQPGTGLSVMVTLPLPATP